MEAPTETIAEPPDSLPLSVVVPAADSPPCLGEVVEAIRSQLTTTDELIVADDPRLATASAARNWGVRAASGSILVFVDSDVVIGDGALERIRSRFAADPGLDGVFGAYDEAPADPGLVSQFRNLLHRQTHLEGAGPAATFWAGLGALRRQPLERAGGFDEEVRWIEDLELGIRMHSCGARLLLDPELEGKHLKRWTLTTMVRTDLFRRGAGWIAVLVRARLRGESWNESALNLGARNRLSALAALGATLALALGRPRAALLSATALAALHHRLYSLLLRTGGPRLALGGWGLHLIHLLCAVASVPVGVGRALLDPAPDRATTPATGP